MDVTVKIKRMRTLLLLLGMVLPLVIYGQMEQNENITIAEVGDDVIVF